MTLGISPKLYAPVIAQLVALVATWVASGEFDRVQLAQAITLAGTALIAYLAGPGEVVVDPGEASDDLLTTQLGGPVEPPR